MILNNHKVLCLLCLILLCPNPLFAVDAVSYKETMNAISSVGLERGLIQMKRSIQKTLPQQVDEVSVLTAVSTEKNIIFYNIELNYEIIEPQIKKKGMTKKYVTDQMIGYVSKNQKKITCSIPSNRALIDSGAIFMNSFSWNTGEFITDSKINSCKH
jgi:hypothetical protein